MDLHDRRNVNRIIRLLAREWNCPQRIVNLTIQNAIDQSWEQAAHDPEIKALWDKHFPNGKPTPEQYILFQGHKFENGEDMPDILGK